MCPQTGMRIICPEKGVGLALQSDSSLIICSAKFCSGAKSLSEQKKKLEALGPLGK